MRRDSNDFDPSQPALLVTYGNTTRKHRYLDNDIIVLGRATNCDFSLMSPEVALVHCVLVRVAGGWKLRDCSGRPGTRVNGKSVQEVVLSDGDIIQVGAFSFQAHLPTVPRPAGVSPAQLEKLQRSRKKLAERALSLRKTLASAHQAAEAALARLAAERAELHKQHEEASARLTAERAEVQKEVELLRSRQRDFELRMTRLELSERDVNTDRATLEKEYKALQEEVERQSTAFRLFREEVARKEREIEERRASVQAELQQLWKEWQQKTAIAPPIPVAPGQDPQLTERARELDLRALELDNYARHLSTLRRQLEGTPAPLAALLDVVSELRDLVGEARKDKRRERSSSRETRTARGETQLNVG